MSVTLQDMQNALSTLGMTLESSPEIRQLAEKVRAEGGTAVPGTGESVRELFSRLGLDSLLPELPAPSASLSAGGGLSMAGLSLETLLDAVGFEQRRAETKAGTASLKAHAQERPKPTRKNSRMFRSSWKSPNPAVFSTVCSRRSSISAWRLRP